MSSEELGLRLSTNVKHKIILYNTHNTGMLHYSVVRDELAAQKLNSKLFAASGPTSSAYITTYSQRCALLAPRAFILIIF